MRNNSIYRISFYPPYIGEKGMGEACSKLLKTKNKRNVIAILMSTVYRYLPAKIKLFAFS